VHNDLLPLNLTNCILRKNCEGGGDGEEQLRIGDFMKSPIEQRVKEIA